MFLQLQLVAQKALKVRIKKLFLKLVLYLAKVTLFIQLKKFYNIFILKNSKKKSIKKIRKTSKLQKNPYLSCLIRNVVMFKHREAVQFVINAQAYRTTQQSYFCFKKRSVSLLKRIVLNVLAIFIIKIKKTYFLV